METLTNIILIDIIIALLFIMNIIFYIKYRRSLKIIERNLDKLYKIISEDKTENIEKQVYKILEKHYKDRL